MKRAVLRCLLPVAALAMLLVPAQAAALERVEQYGLGSPSAGGGGVVTMFGLAVSPDGTVVASDIGFQRISIFAQSGQFQRAFGKDVSLGGGTGAEICTNDCKAGAAGPGAGELSAPWGVAAGADEIYVAENGNNRISVFDYQGRFLRAFGANVGGAGVNVCTVTCVAGTAGTAAGQLAGPFGVAVDPASGNLFVSEGGSVRIDVFNPKSGQFLRAFGKDVGGPGVNTCTNPCLPGVADGTPGSIAAAFGLAISPAGELYVSEIGANRISVFSLAGQILRTIASPGSAAGQIASPYGAAPTPDGLLYVSDSGNNRLSSFTVGGAFQSALGLDVIPGGVPMVETCTSATGCKQGAAGTGIGEFSSPFALATDCRGGIYVANQFRIDKFAEPGTASPPCPPPPSPVPPVAQKPSNQFKFAPKVKQNKKKGTASITVEVPGAGALTASAGKRFSAKVPQPTAVGKVVVTVKAAGKGVKALNASGKLKGTLSVTYTPTGGDPATQTLKFQLVKRKKGKGKSGQGKAGNGKQGKGQAGE